MSTDNDVPWSGPEPDDTLPWEQKDEPPSRPLPQAQKPSPPKAKPFFQWIGGVLQPVPPACPKCAGPVEYRKRDDSCWCRTCDEGFSYRSVVDLLHAAGLWYL